MTETLTAHDLYGERYFRTYPGVPYERSEYWLRHFGDLAQAIVRDVDPSSVLDVGCAKGFLVEALRDRGVDAWGIDLSEHAIDQVREDIKPHCSVASILEPLDRRYDLLVCIDVLQHLDPSDAERAVENLCGATTDVLFASSPDGVEKDTHRNVQPPEYWAGLFAKYGFFHDLALDVPLVPRAMRFRGSEPLHRAVVSYERRLWALATEVKTLRERAIETAAELARQERAAEEKLSSEPRVAQLEHTVAEQTRHLDALNEDLDFMRRRQAELRTMLHTAHEQLLDAQQQLDAGSRPDIASLQAELARAQQHARNVEAALAQSAGSTAADLAATQQHATDLERQLMWHQEALRQWEARAADLETRLARVRNSPAGRAYRFISGLLR